jgi:hypothetical protein
MKIKLIDISSSGTAQESVAEPIKKIKVKELGLTKTVVESLIKKAKRAGEAGT